MDEAISIVETAILPTARVQPGYQGYLQLVDRATGDGLNITLSASVEAMRAGETSSYYCDQIDKVRGLLEGEPDVHGYEVVLHDVRPD
jgi:hypothetical protein